MMMISKFYKRSLPRVNIQSFSLIFKCIIFIISSIIKARYFKVGQNKTV